MMLLRTSVLAIIALVSLADALAQVERVLPRRGGSSLEGTSFVVGFMANEILEVGEDPRVQVFVSSQFDATVTLTSPLSGPSTYTIPANTIRTFDVSPQHVVNASEQVAPKALFIEADVPIVVYTLNTLALSSDSYTAIPIKHCGTDYYTVNRPTDWYRQGRTMNPLDRAPRVGEFMIMATEDGTDIVIDPRVETKGGRRARQTFSVRLNRGECYLVQARATRHGSDDLTGSSITANLPVAVLSGHMRSSIPTDSTISKDHLVEQLPPVSSWGRTYASSPFTQIVRPDAFRVVGSRNNQTVRLTTRYGSATFTLATPGQWVDTVLKEPAYWTSDEPFLLTQYMSSSTSGAYGDPAMVIVPPVEQFVNQAMFQFPMLEKAGLDNQQFFYFVNVVAEATSLPTLRVNTTPVTTLAPAITTQTIPGTSLHWATLQLSEGAFLMQADTGLVSGVMYGTSIVDSYANMIGVAYDSIRTDDETPPIYQLAVECGSVSGTVRDTSIGEPVLDELRVVQSRTTNYRWSFAPSFYVPGALDVDAQVKDLWRDAQIVFHAYDDQGNGREWLYRYDAPDVNVPADIVVDATGGGQQCTTAVLRNRDSTPVTIARITLRGDSRFSLGSSWTRDTVIAPGDSLVITVCMQRTSDTSQARGSLVIEYPCRLQRFVNVRSSTVSSLGTIPFDFGDVRVGDTACGRLPIINTGPTDVVITALLFDRRWPQFRVNIASLNLPRLVKPNDTMWVEACFTPDTVGDFQRDDTVRSLPECGLLTRVQGRGVQPEIPSVIIDCRQRPVGVAADSSIRVRNNGSGWAIVHGWAAWNTTPVTSRGPNSPVRIAAGESIELPCTLIPIKRGPFEQVDTLLVDWGPHRLVTVRHIGIGVQPDLRAADIDFGQVALGLHKDSLAEHFVSGSDGGNAPVRIFDIRITGPDAAAFIVPDSVLNRRSVFSIDTVRGLTRFTPLRVGSHVCTVELRHNGAYGGGDSTTVYTLRGNGVRATAPRLVTSISARGTPIACAKHDVLIAIENLGDGRTRIDSIIVFDSRRTIVVDTDSGIVVEPGDRREWQFPWIVDRTSDRLVTVRVVDSLNNVYTEQFLIDITMPAVRARLEIDNAPLLQTGIGELRAQLILDAVKGAPDTPKGYFTIPIERFVLSTDSLRVRGVAAGVVLDTMIPAAQTDDRIAFDLPETSGPWMLTLEARGTFLWADPTPFSVEVGIDSTPCYDGMNDGIRDIQVVPCGAAARVVKLGERASIVARVLQSPVRDVLSLEIESSAYTAVRITIETLTGQHFALVEGFSLQKGVQHCNFSCSGWASGVYRVLIHGDSGETDCKVIIVN